MVEGRKTARKTATRIRKNTAKATARRAGSVREKSAKEPSAKASPKRWSQRVTRESNALDLKQGVFKLRDPSKVAASLKRSAERSSRRKAGTIARHFQCWCFISTAPARRCRKRSVTGCSAPRPS